MIIEGEKKIPSAKIQTSAEQERPSAGRHGKEGVKARSKGGRVGGGGVSARLKEQGAEREACRAARERAHRQGGVPIDSKAWFRRARGVTEGRRVVT